MKYYLTKLLIAFSTFLSINILVNSQSTGQNSQTVNYSKSDSILFNSLITQYLRSINQADTALAQKFWSQTPEISFINPRGTEYGWNGIKNIYNMFRDNFTERKLSADRIKFANYGEFAWLEFSWVFDATMKVMNKTIQTRGRETQVWRKINNEWRLVHVHYSGMPVTGQGQGF
jgi:hypothetical protein